MKFYTYVAKIGNRIYSREVDNKGETYSGYTSFKPTLYLPAPPDKSDYKSLDNEYLGSHTFDSIKDCQSFLSSYDGTVNYSIHGNRNYVSQYITETYPDLQWDSTKIEIFNLDIETSIENGFPDIRIANSAITAITVYSSTADRYFVFGMGKYNPDQPDKAISYFESDTEREMLKLFIDWWAINIPDIVTGWNIKFFDIPYIINRLKRFGLKAELLSPIKNLYEKNIKIAGKDNQTYLITGVSVLDYLDLYKKYTYKIRESYRLDYIGKVELGLRKDQDEIPGYELYKTDYQKFINYNIRDVEIVKKLDDKMKLMDLIITMAYDSGINFEDVFSPVKTWESIIYRFLKEKKISIPAKKEQNSTRTIEGGYVKDPQVGLHNWVVSFDLASLYPHLIQQYNISPETLHTGIVCADSENIGVEGLLEQKLDTDYLKQTELTLTPNGQHFTLKKKGFLPQLMNKMYNDRVIYKKKMLEEQQKLESGIYKNKQEVINNISTFNNIQMSKKILLNSAYGALANQYFLYYSPEQAEAITMSGQLSIRWIEKHINKYINKLLSTEDNDYVIAIDTDSIYVTFDKLVNTVLPKGTEIAKIVSFLDTVCKDKIESYIEESYKLLDTYLNAYEQKMFMEREVIADKGIWTAKKRYILNVYNNEGVSYKEPKLKIMGLESVRSSTPEWCRDNLHELIKIIITTNEKTVIKSIDEYRDQFKKLKFIDIAFPRSVRGLDKYKSSKDIYIKATPIHVRGVLLYNHFLREQKLTNKYELIRDGDKIKFAYLKEPNKIGENVIAISSILPKEFNLDKYIDYDTQFDKSFLQPVKNILNAIGWKSENVGSLESFF
ncbi:MAG: DNA polymerase [Acidimicrobiaceae bacterium]|nr:DNA polymerase [Acidimicrobiaceae bacterium]|tara:strand:+ start:993 stop:3503 length:2511 start_codon:yes stop_codon:yes gene_type:complete